MYIGMIRIVCWGDQYRISIRLQLYIGPIMYYNLKNDSLMALLVSLLYSTQPHNVYIHNWLQLTYKICPFILAFIFVQYIFEWTLILMMIVLLQLGRLGSQWLMLLLLDTATARHGPTDQSASVGTRS